MDDRLKAAIPERCGGGPGKLGDGVKWLDQPENDLLRANIAALAHENDSLRAALRDQARMTEKAFDAVNRNADLGEAAEADAKRYRWLRGGKPESARWPRWRVEYWTGQEWSPQRDDDLDALIDGFIRAELG